MTREPLAEGRPLIAWPVPP